MILVRVTSPNIEEEEVAHVVSEFQYPLHHRLFALFFGQPKFGGKIDCFNLVVLCQVLLT